MHKKSSSRLIRILSIKEFFFKSSQYVFKHFDELKKNTDLFDDAKVMWFYAGELFSDFYNSESFLRALIKSINTGGKMSAVFGPALYVENKEFLALALTSDKIELYKRSFRDPIHFKLMRKPDDKIMAILDKEHPVNVDKDDRYSVLVTKGYENEITFLAKKFEQSKQESTRITMGNLFEEFVESKVDEKGELRGFITPSGNDAVPASEDQVNELRAYLKKKASLKIRSYEDLIP